MHVTTNQKNVPSQFPLRVCDKFMGKRSLSTHTHPALPLKAGLDTHLTQGANIIALNSVIFTSPDYEH
jgi:hypothetical protein